MLTNATKLQPRWLAIGIRGFDGNFWTRTRLMQVYPRLSIALPGAGPFRELRGADIPVAASRSVQCARSSSWWVPVLIAGLAVISGCKWRFQEAFHDPELSRYKEVATQIEYPQVTEPPLAGVREMVEPLTIRDVARTEFWDLQLADSISLALQNSSVLRDLGGAVLQTPEAARTKLDPALRESDPRFGVEAALAAFDASFEASAFFENNDRALNNIFLGGGTRLLKQDLGSMRAQLSKRAATGTQFTLRNVIDYDANNSPGNQFPSAWTEYIEGEFRHPLLQGGGLDFNRIAGPRAVPGLMNGVVLARINTDVSLAEFEIGTRNLVNDVETAYWELYYAYRDLDARIAARDRALQTWRSIQALYATGRRGGEAEKEAAAREQYYRLEEEVQNALTGRQVDRVRATTFRGTGGVQLCERRLRLIMGIPCNDGQLIRPSDEPLLAKVIFDWNQILLESLQRREELRRQRWVVKRRELEFLASKNFLLPQMDAVGRYRFRGFGHDLLSSERQPERFDNAFQDLTTGDFQEWQMGMEMQMPVGYRRGHAAVQYARLNLQRERTILDEQEREVAHDLSNALADLERSYAVSQTNFNRRQAAQDQLAALESVYQDADEGEKTRLLDLLLDSQRRLADAETNFYRTLCEYTLAVKQVHYQKGTLLDYNAVLLSEGPWGKG